MVGFSSNATTITVEVNGKVQGDRLRALVANFHGGNCPVDLDEALSHSLSSIGISRQK